MKTLTKNGIIYIMEEGKEEFVFTVCENGYKRALSVKSITSSAAEGFYHFLAENGIAPGHLAAVAEDYDFVEISVV